MLVAPECLDDVDDLDDPHELDCLLKYDVGVVDDLDGVCKLSPLPQGMLRMRGEYGIMVDADAATDIRDLDHLLIRMGEIEREEVVKGGGGDSRVKHGMVVGSRAHMEGDAVAKVMLRGKTVGWDAAGPGRTTVTGTVTVPVLVGVSATVNCE